MVRDGGARKMDRFGNNAAVEAADFGRCRVNFPVIDARRNLSGVCGRVVPGSCPSPFFSLLCPGLWGTIHARRRLRNSCWRCRRLYLFRLCSGLWSNSVTFQFLLVVVVRVAKEAFKAFLQDRALQRTVEQNSLASQIQIVVEAAGSCGSLQGFRPGQNSTADVEQNVDIPARGGLHGFLPVQGSSSSSRLHDVADEDFTGFFRIFPRLKKVRSWVRTRGRN